MNKHQKKLNKLTNNYIDKAMVCLIFECVKGRPEQGNSLEELRNLKKTDIIPESNTNNDCSVMGAGPIGMLRKAPTAVKAANNPICVISLILNFNVISIVIISSLFKI